MGTGVADGVAGPASVEDIVPSAPGCAEDRALMSRIMAILQGYPAGGHIQACFLNRAYQGHISGAFARDLKVHGGVRLSEPS